MRKNHDAPNMPMPKKCVYFTEIYHPFYILNFMLTQARVWPLWSPQLSTKTFRDNTLYNIYLFEFEKIPKHHPPLTWLLIGRRRKIIHMSVQNHNSYVQKIPTQILHQRFIHYHECITHFSLRHMSFSLKRWWHFL